MARPKKYKIETRIVKARIEKHWAEVIKILPEIANEYSNESDIVRKALLYFLNEKVSSEHLETAFNEIIERGAITEDEVQLLKA